MKSYAERKEEVKQLIAAANILDDEGQAAEADRLTKLAKLRIEAMEDDKDIEDADSPVSGDDPFEKGFGKSIQMLCKKLDNVLSANNLKRKLRELCEAAGKDAKCAREIERKLEDACDALQEIRS